MAAKKPAAKKGGSRHTRVLTEFLRTAAPRHKGRVDAAKVRARLVTAGPDAQALYDAMLTAGTYFALGDFQTYPDLALRRGLEALAPGEVPVARNGAGDVWVAEGRVRFLVHDLGFGERARHQTFDDFLEAALWSVLENLQPDDVDDLRGEIAVAVAIAGEDALDDEVRERLEA